MLFRSCNTARATFARAILLINTSGFIFFHGTAQSQSACYTDYNCLPNQYCTTNGMCALDKTAAMSCWRNEECQTGMCQDKACSAFDAEGNIPFEYRIPVHKPDHVYTTKREKSGTIMGAIYSEEEALAALPEAWKEQTTHVSDFSNFPAIEAPLSHRIPDGKGGLIDISQAPTDEQLQAIKNNLELPSANKMLADLQAGIYDEKAHTFYIYGGFNQQVIDYYYLYRISNDRYYLDQIVEYAKIIEWLMQNRPDLVVPLSMRENMPEKLREVFPHEPSMIALFRAPTTAAWLLLESVENNRSQDPQKDIEQAKKFIYFSKPWINVQVYKGYQAPNFNPGKNTLEIQQVFAIPERAAETIEYFPFNGTWWYCSTLAAQAKAIELYQNITGTNRKRLTSNAVTYRKIVNAAITVFERESTTVVRAGWPYIFHGYNPLKDNALPIRAGATIFKGEDFAHAGSGAINFTYIWDIDENFGVDETLLRAYANSFLLHYNDPTKTDKKGEAKPGHNFNSPWSHAAIGIDKDGGKTAGVSDRFYRFMAFSPYVIETLSRYKKNPTVLEDNNTERLYAGYIYRLAEARREQSYLQTESGQQANEVDLEHP